MYCLNAILCYNCIIHMYTNMYAGHCGKWMGINKPDVRVFLHQTISKLVNYYQESGRACMYIKMHGQRHTASYYIDPLTLSSKVSWTFKIIEECIYSIIGYCYGNGECRRANHVGDVWKQIDYMCDVCHCSTVDGTVSTMHKSSLFLADNTDLLIALLMW